jgi:hypothetical protein
MAEFQFADDASEANALAAAITPVVRPVINASIPMGLITAVDQSSGKTTLADFISILATGSHGGYKGAPSNPEEWGKRITSALRTGSPVIVIDNVKETQPLARICAASSQIGSGLSESYSFPGKYEYLIVLFGWRPGTI